MSPSSMAIFMKPPSTLNHHHKKFNNFLSKTWFSRPTFCTSNYSASVHYRKPVRFKKKMASASMEKTRFLSGDDDDDDKHISPKVSGLHILVNCLSKWVVALTMGGFLILRHDAVALWAATGSVSNFILSIALKRVLKQDRPVSEVSSGHGMPSTHAQTVFFAIVVVIISVIEWMGLNGVTAIFGILLVALGSYFSWLRILLGYHTTSQVVVGSILGSNFAILWFWAWEPIVSSAYNSNPWIQILLLVGVACCYIVLIFYIFRHYYIYI